VSDSNQKKNEKKLLVGIAVVGWVIFIGLFVGRAIGVILTHDDVTSIGDFFGRLVNWSDLGFFVFLIAMTIAAILNKKKANEE
jgi:Na+/H+-dicarboxylate symporter